MRETSSLNPEESEYLEIKPISLASRPPFSATISFPPDQKVPIPNSSGANSLRKTTPNSSTIWAISSTEESNSSTQNTKASSLITQKTHPTPLASPVWKKTSIKSSHH